MKIFRKTTILLFSVLLIALSFNKDKKVIVIDAGHGGNDKGAMYDHHMEKDIVLAVANKIKQLNKNSDIEIILTRDGDHYPSLSDRSEFVNKLNPDLVISLHMNRNQQKDTDRNGVEIYYSEKNAKAEQSKALANELASRFNNALVKDVNLHILRESNSPALIVEMGFLNNKEDREYITQAYGQNETAKKILDFLDMN